MFFFLDISYITYFTIEIYEQEAEIPIIGFISNSIALLTLYVAYQYEHT